VTGCQVTRTSKPRDRFSRYSNWLYTLDSPRNCYWWQLCWLV